MIVIRADSVSSANNLFNPLTARILLTVCNQFIPKNLVNTTIFGPRPNNFPARCNIRLTFLIALPPPTMSVTHANVIQTLSQGADMTARLFAAAALVLLNLSMAHAVPAPDYNYLQNALDGRGRCLGAAGDRVAMAACAKSPNQQWITAAGDLPGYNRLTTLGEPQLCLAVQPGNRRNQVAMAPCSADAGQQWYLVRLGEATGRLRITNRAIGQTRCLEAQQTGLKLTPCSRRQAGHFWHADYLPTM
jgi:hypothetical protein